MNAKNELTTYQAYDQDGEALEIRACAIELLSQAKNLQVTDSKTEQEGLTLATTIKELLTKIEVRRKIYVQPLDQVKKMMQAFFKSIADPLEQANAIARNAMIAYKNKLEEARRKEEEKNRKKIETAIEKGKPVPMVVAPEEHKSVKTESGGLTYKKAWVFQVVVEDKVPREFCKPDDAKIRLAVASGVREIAGVNIYEETKTILR